MNPTRYVILLSWIKINTYLCATESPVDFDIVWKTPIKNDGLALLFKNASTSGSLNNNQTERPVKSSREIINTESPPGVLCDPSSANLNLNCGTLEYLGCTGKKQFFHESTVKVTWFEAWEYCRTYGMHLATIESRYEHLFLETYLEKPQKVLVETYWTSGNRFSGPFTWMATGKLITYANWRAGEPNNRNNNEFCVEIVTMSNTNDFRWNDRVCNSLAYALCQKDIL